MGEADPVALELDHAGLGCAAEIAVCSCSGADRLLDEGDGRAGQRRGDQKRLGRRAGEQREPRTDELAQARRHGKGLTRRRLGSRAAERARELEREEGIAAR